MAKTKNINLELTTDPDTLFEDWSKSINGEGKATDKSDYSNAQLIDEAFGLIGETVSNTQQALQDLADDIAKKQDILEDNKNIKTINGESILGTGDITVESGTAVEANPTGTTTDKLTSIKISDKLYSIPVSEVSEEQIDELYEYIDDELGFSAGQGEDGMVYTKIVQEAPTDITKLNYFAFNTKMSSDDVVAALEIVLGEYSPQTLVYLDWDDFRSREGLTTEILLYGDHIDCAYTKRVPATSGGETTETTWMEVFNKTTSWNTAAEAFVNNKGLIHLCDIDTRRRSSYNERAFESLVSSGVIIPVPELTVWEPVFKTAKSGLHNSVVTTKNTNTPIAANGYIDTLTIDLSEENLFRVFGTSVGGVDNPVVPGLLWNNANKSITTSTSGAEPVSFGGRVVFSTIKNLGEVYAQLMVSLFQELDIVDASVFNFPPTGKALILEPALGAEYIDLSKIDYSAKTPNLMDAVTLVEWGDDPVTITVDDYGLDCVNFDVFENLDVAFSQLGATWDELDAQVMAFLEYFIVKLLAGGNIQLTDNNDLVDFIYATKGTTTKDWIVPNTTKTISKSTVPTVGSTLTNKLAKFTIGNEAINIDKYIDAVYFNASADSYEMANALYNQLKWIADVSVLAWSSTNALIAARSGHTVALHDIDCASDATYPIFVYDLDQRQLQVDNRHYKLHLNCCPVDALLALDQTRPSLVWLLGPTRINSAENLKALSKYIYTQANVIIDTKYIDYPVTNDDTAMSLKVVKTEKQLPLPNYHSYFDTLHFKADISSADMRYLDNELLWVGYDSDNCASQLVNKNIGTAIWTSETDKIDINLTVSDVGPIIINGNKTGIYIVRGKDATTSDGYDLILSYADNEVLAYYNYGTELGGSTHLLTERFHNKIIINSSLANTILDLQATGQPDTYVNAYANYMAKQETATNLKILERIISAGVIEDDDYTWVPAASIEKVNDNSQQISILETLVNTLCTELGLDKKLEEAYPQESHKSIIQQLAEINNNVITNSTAINLVTTEIGVEDKLATEYPID